MKKILVLLLLFTASTFSLISSVPVTSADNEINPVLTISDDPVPTESPDLSTVQDLGCDGDDSILSPSIGNTEYLDQYEQYLLNEGLLPSSFRKEDILPYLFLLLSLFFY